MKNYKPKIIVLGVVFVAILGIFTQNAALAESNTVRVQLEGLELAKGFDITDSYRKGTIFAGEIKFNSKNIGYWTAILSHTGTQNIEVCQGRGQIVSMILTLNFSFGERLILGMKRGSRGLVEWDYNYEGESCGLGGVGCDSCGDAEIVTCGTNNTDTSNVATVGKIPLVQKRGSTIKIESAVLESARLCHYFPIIPRVSAGVKIIFK